MVVDYGRKILFCHNPKTAGTSIEKFMSGIGGTSHEDLDIYKHIRFRQIRDLWGNEEYEKYLSFSVIRIPASRLFSKYFFVRRAFPKSEEAKMSNKLNFDDWVNWLIDNGKVLAQSEFFTDYDGSSILCNYIIRFENLIEDLEHMSSNEGLDIGWELPMLIVSKPNDRFFYEELSKDTIEKINKTFHKDVELYKKIGHRKNKFRSRCE